MQNQRLSHYLLFGASIVISLVACSSRSVIVEREAVERTRAEAFEAQFDSIGVLQYDRENGARAYGVYCSGCHGTDGRAQQNAENSGFRSLGASAVNNSRRFWQILNFGDHERGMKAFDREASFQDLVDIVGFVQTLPQGK